MYNFDTATIRKMACAVAQASQTAIIDAALGDAAACPIRATATVDGMEFSVTGDCDFDYRDIDADENTGVSRDVEIVHTRYNISDLEIYADDEIPSTVTDAVREKLELTLNTL